MQLVHFRPRTNWSPLRELRSLQDEFNRVFDAPELSGDGVGSSRTWKPALDIDTTENGYHLTLDLPGIPQDQIQVSVHDGVLSVKGERKSERTEEKDGCHRAERWSGSFERSVVLPKDANGAAAEAKHENGVLTVTVPRAEEAKPKQIEIKRSILHPVSP